VHHAGDTGGKVQPTFDLLLPWCNIGGGCAGSHSTKQCCLEFQVWHDTFSVTFEKLCTSPVYRPKRDGIGIFRTSVRPHKLLKDTKHTRPRNPLGPDPARSEELDQTWVAKVTSWMMFHEKKSSVDLSSIEVDRSLPIRLMFLCLIELKSSM
jgi:hypothetical protein